MLDGFFCKQSYSTNFLIAYVIFINRDNHTLKVDLLLKELEFRKIDFDIFFFQTIQDDV